MLPIFIPPGGTYLGVVGATLVPLHQVRGHGDMRHHLRGRTGDATGPRTGSLSGGERLRHLDDWSAASTPTTGNVANASVTWNPPGACRRCQEWKLPTPGTPRDTAGAPGSRGNGGVPGGDPVQTSGTHPGLPRPGPTRRTAHRHHRRGKASGLPPGGARRDSHDVQEEPVAPSPPRFYPGYMTIPGRPGDSST